MDPEKLELGHISTDEILTGISGRDPIMGELVKRIGYFKLEAGGDHFESLVQAIIYQQISGKAAESIYNKFLKKLGGPVIPENIARLSDAEFRSSGISPQKMRYLRDLSGKTLSGELNLSGIELLPNSEIVQKLTIVKGIGIWSAQMFLIFTLGRLNVLPLNDLGFRNSLKKHYGISGELTDTKITKIASKWAPYISAGVWILWECENTKLPALATGKRVRYSPKSP